MPIYLYKCKNCGANVEKMQSVTADPLVECPECHQLTLKKVLTPAGIIFKGSGWYVTDSRKSSSAVTPSGSTGDNKAPEKTGAESSTAATEKSEKSSGDSKVESKSSEPA